MKFAIEQEALLEKLNVVSGTLTGSNTIPILNCVYINAKKDRIEFCTNDNIIYVSTYIPIEPEEEGATCIFAKDFIALIKSLTPKQINFKLEKDKLLINQNKTKVKLNTFDAKEFPRKGNKTYTNLTFKSAILHSIIRLVSIAMGTSVGFDINAMLFEITDKNGLNLIATNGKRLASFRTGKKAKSFLVPYKTVAELMKILPSSKEITIGVSDTEVSFTTPQITLISSLLENIYPDYEKVIPPKTNSVATINRENLLQAIKRVGLFIDAKKLNDPIVFNFNSGLTLSKVNALLGEIEDKIEANFKNDAVTIGFNPKFITDILEVITDKEVSFEVHGADKPLVYRNGDFVYLALPIRL